MWIKILRTVTSDRRPAKDNWFRITQAGNSKVRPKSRAYGRKKKRTEISKIIRAQKTIYRQVIQQKLQAQASSAILFDNHHYAYSDLADLIFECAHNPELELETDKDLIIQDNPPQLLEPELIPSSTCGNPKYTPDIAVGESFSLDRRHSRIVGGNTAKAHSYPWQVSFRYKNYYTWSHLCGGAILDNWHVISAAHCELQMSDKIALGDHEIGCNSKAEEKNHFGIAKLYQHPQYSSKLYSAGLSYDYVIVRLDREIKFNDKISPICLPDQSSSTYPAGTECLVSGWGFIDGAGQTSPRYLQQGKLSLISSRECKRIWGPMTDHEVCAGSETVSGCKGDSGGPLACFNQKLGRYELFGVVSWGSNDCAMFEQPSVFARIDKVLPWIQQVTSGRVKPSRSRAGGYSGVGYSTNRNTTRFSSGIYNVPVKPRTSG